MRHSKKLNFLHQNSASASDAKGLILLEKVIHRYVNSNARFEGH